MPFIGKQNQYQSKYWLDYKDMAKEEKSSYDVLSCKEGKLSDLLRKLHNDRLGPLLEFISGVLLLLLQSSSHVRVRTLFPIIQPIDLGTFFYVRSISKALTKLSKLITKVNVKAPGNPNVYHTNVEESVLLRHFMEPKVPTMCLAAPPLNEKLKYHTAHRLPTSS